MQLYRLDYSLITEGDKEGEDSNKAQEDSDKEAEDSDPDWVESDEDVVHREVVNPVVQGDKEREGNDEDVVHMEVPNPEEAALNFLSRYPTAKIIIVVDTHSVENGAFAWTSNPNNRKDVKTCYLYEVKILFVFASINTDHIKDPRRMYPPPDFCIYLG